jgi:hypothetical protein
MKAYILLFFALSSLAIGQTKTVTVNNSGVLTFPSAATFRANNGAATGIKQWATGAAIMAGVADFDGQLEASADGGLALYGRTTGNHGGVAILDDIIYVKNIQTSVALSAATSTNAGILFGSPVGPYVDNIISIYNLSGGFASTAMYRPADGGVLPSNSSAVAFGYGPGTTRGSPGPYNDRVYIGLSPAGTAPTANPPDYIVSQEQAAGGSGYLAHVRVELDGVTKNYRLRKFDNTTAVGALSLESASTGEIGIGAAASTLSTLRVGAATVQNIGVTWSGYFGLTGLNRFGIDGASGTGLELIESGTREWIFTTSGGTLGVFSSPNSTNAITIDQASLTVAMFASKVGANGVSFTRLRHGLATLSGGTVVVSDANVTASSRIILTSQANTATGALRVSARTAGTSFTITSSNAGDSGSVAYEMIEP